MIERIIKDNLDIIKFDNQFKIYSKEILDNPFSQVYVYTINNEVVGIIQYDIIYERAELSQIEVKQEYRNQNIASELMDYMLTDCKQKEVKNITLEVKKDNEIAIHLYEKYGFKEVAIRKGYYQGIDGILMEKEMIE